MDLFAKKDGTSGVSGQLYEIKLAIHFLLRGLIAKRQGDIDNFYLGTNVDTVNGFDDVVFKYERNKNGETESRIVLLQAKHKDKRTTITPDKLLSDASKNVDYNVRFYLESFAKTKSTILDTDDPVLKGGFPNCEFVLFANASFDSNDASFANEPVDFWRVNDRKRIKFDSGESSRIYRSLRVPLDFSRLVEELIDWVEKRKIFTRKRIYQIYQRPIERYVLSVDGNAASFADDFLRGSDDLPAEIRMLREYFFANAEKMFDVTDLNDFRMCVEKGHGRVDADRRETIITEVPVCEITQFLKQFSMLFDQPGESELEDIIKLHIRLYLGVVAEEAKFIYDNVYSRIQHWWKFDNYYITELNDYFLESQNNLKLMSDIDSNIKFYREKNLIYQPANKLNGLIMRNAFVHIVSRGSSQVLYEAQIFQILNEMNVKCLFLKMKTFQRFEEAALKAFDNEYDALVITDSKTIRLIESNNRLLEIVSGNQTKKVILICENIVTSLSFEVVADLNVKFTNLNAEVQKRILRETDVEFQGNIITLEKIILPGLKHTILDEMLSDIVLKNRPVVIGRKIRRDDQSYHIARTLKCSSCDVVKPEDLLRKGEANKFILVTAEPGMGKSTLLSSLSKEIYNLPRCVWHYRIDLIDHSGDFAKSGKLDALCFLRKACNMDEFEFALFSAYFKSYGKIILFFDGFDEISPEYKNVVLDLLSGLDRSKVEMMWITSRTCIKQELEKRLNTRAYSLEPLSVDDQRNILKVFWKKDDRAIESILNKFSNSIDDCMRQFMGVPLQLKMFMEVHDESNFDDEINLFRMYESFFKKKYFDVQCASKGKADIDNLHIRKLMEKDYNDTRMIYEKLAILSLYEEHLAHLLSAEAIEEIRTKTLEEVKDGNEKSGIVNSVVGGMPIFVHRTFAEFFAASFLARAVDADKKIGEFLIAIGFFDPSRTVMRIFLDLALGDQEEIFRAVLNNDLERLHRLKLDMMVRDKGGRTVLHLAAQRGHLAAAKILLYENADVWAIDGLFNWRPATYADKCRMYDVLELLSVSGARIEDMHDTLRLVANWRNGDFTLVHRLSRTSNSSLLRAILTIRPELVGCRSRENSDQTPLHMAADRGWVDTVKMLLDAMKLCQGSKYASDDFELNINCRDSLGRSPLDIAVERWHCETIKILIEYGSILPRSDYQKLLHKSSEKGNSSFLTFLSANDDKITEKCVDLVTKCSLSCPYFFPLDKLTKAIRENNLNKVKKIYEKHRRSIDEVLSDNGNNVDNSGYRLGKEHEFLNLEDVFNTKSPTKYILRAQIQYALEHDYIKIIKYLVTQNNKWTIDNRSTLLHSACTLGKLTLVDFLLKQGVDPLFKDKGGKTCLHWAVAKGQLEILKFVLTAVKNWTTVVDEEGLTLLHTAAITGRLDILIYLCKQTDNPLIRDNHSRTFLNHAIQMDRLDIVKHFISSNKHWVDITDLYNNTLLHQAVRCNKLEIAVCLLTHGANPMATSGAMQTSLDMAVECGHFEICKRLFEFINTDKNYFLSSHYFSLLCLASNNNDKEILAYLLEMGADPMAHDEYGFTCLHTACNRGNVEIVKCLLSANSDLVNAKTTDGVAPLHLAAMFNRIEIVDYLLEQGANPLTTDHDGKTFVDYAICGGHMGILKRHIGLLKEWTLKNPREINVALGYAVMNGWLEISLYLMGEGADPIYGDPYGYTAMHNCVMSESPRILEYLLALDKSWMDVRSKAGTTLLNLAAIFDRMEILVFLLEQGADPTVRDDFGRTCFDYATLGGQHQIMKYYPFL